MIPAETTSVTEIRPLFENADWCVLPEGLEHKDTGYFIDRAVAADRRDDGAWSWLDHMAEKSWCEPASFAEAFVRGLTAWGVPIDTALIRSVMGAGRGRGAIVDSTDAVALGDVVAGIADGARHVDPVPAERSRRRRIVRVNPARNADIEAPQPRRRAAAG